MNVYIIYKYLQTCKEFTTNKSSIKIFTRKTLKIYTLEQRNLVPRLFWEINEEVQKLN